ncbi:MAG: hypothetical protein E6Q32_09980 [Neisseriales bacterium]|nr:MAG: hypothetical protein E6Q32_09980 [Neisseriales bacterium]
MRNFISILFTSLALVACGNGSCSSLSGGGNIPPTPTTTNLVTISSSSTMPLLNNMQGASYYLQADSFVNQTLTLVDVKVRPVDSSNNSLFAKLKASFKSLLGGNVNNLVDASACQTLAPSGSCALKVTPTDNSGGLFVNLDFKDPTGKIYTAAQVVSYQSGLPSSNGFIYANNNNLLSVVNNRKSTVAIPFILDDNYSALNVIANLPILSRNIICNGGAYTKGNLCTALISFPGTNNALNVSLQGTKTDGSLNNAQFNYQMTINAIANLVVDASNLVINPADGTDDKLITVLNTGNATATITGVSGAPSALGIGSNTCSGNLAVNGSCTFTVDANSSINGQGTVTIAYNNGSTSTNIAFNAIYIATPNTPSITLIPNGNLQYVVANSPHKTLTVNVANSGNSVLNNLKFNSLPNAKFVYLTSGVTTPCALDGSQNLALGTSCNIAIEYTPTSVETGNIISQITANYTNSQNQTTSYNSPTLTTPYSAIQSEANLSISASPQNPSVRADGVATVEQTFTITNGASIPATQINYTLPFVTSQTTVSNNCGSSLASGSSCSITLRYGPFTTTQSLPQNLTVSYLPTPVSSAVQAIDSYTLETVTAALINVSYDSSTPAATAWGDLSGSGSDSSPWVFSSSSGNQLTFSYKYTNDGMADATKFNVALNQLPFGYILSSSTCPTGTSTTTLAVGASCIITLNVVAPIVEANFYPTGSMNITAPGYSYIDANTGVNQNFSTGVSNYVTVNSWGTVTNSVGTVIKNGDNTQTIPINFTLAGLSSHLTSAVVTPQLIDGFTASPASCTLTTASPTCLIDLTAASYVPVTSYTISYNYSNDADADIRVGYTTFTLLP